MGAIAAVYVGFPIAVFLFESTKAGVTNQGLGSSGGLLNALAISIVTASISTVLIALFMLPLAWSIANAKRKFLANIVSFAVSIPLALPPLVSGILLIHVIGPLSWLGSTTGGRLTDSVIGIIIAQSFVSAPFAFITARASFANIDPGLNDMARTYGLSDMRRFT
ncbi:MAG: ABC transporter permease subunit [Acidimicrobiales bacterium]|nr:ABC transporter permease subunit [Acidimicrobiales bacterium]